MTRHFFLTLLLAFTFAVTVAQNNELIERLKKELNSEKSEQKRFSLLNRIAWEYRWAYPDSTVIYADMAYRLGQQLGLKKGLAEPLNYAGVAYNYEGDRLKSFEYYQQALSVANGQQDSVQIAHSHNNLGRLFFEQGILSRSYDQFIEALAIFEAINDSSGLAYTYQSLANLYKTQRDFEKAESNYLKAYKIRLSLGNTRDIMSALAQLGRFYQDGENPEKAILYLERADSAGRVINDQINLAEIKTLIAETYLSQNKLMQAEKMCGEGLAVIQRAKNIRMLPQAYITMGRIQMAKRALGDGRAYLNKALEIATNIVDLNSKMEAHYWLWKLSEKENNEREVLINRNQYLILRDSVKDLDLAREVERLQFENVISRKEQENELLKAVQAKNDAVIQQQRLQNIILIIVVLSVSLVGFIQWMASKRRKLINEKLEEQNHFIHRQRQEIIEQNEKLSRRNHELSDLNYEKDTLMSIVAHDLKSPLNRISGMVEIMELEGGLTPSQRLYLNMTKQATRAGLDLIKDLLDVHMLQENIQPQFVRSDLSEFMLDKTRAFGPSAEAKEIHLHISRVESEEVNMDVTYTGRILDNLLSNAIKFSKPKSEILISGGKSKDYFWLSVKDNGPGFSEKDKNQLFQRFKKLTARPTAGESSNGLGLAIVKTLVDRLNGTIELLSEPGKGSEFVVKLPLVAVTEETITATA